MSQTETKLSQAIRTYREQTTNCYEVEAIQAFIGLYNMLGETELHDGIQTAMQDAGYEEAYEEIMYTYDDIIQQSGE